MWTAIRGRTSYDEFRRASVSFLKGKADGDFETKIDYITGDGPARSPSRDVTGDGTLDIVTADYSDSTVSVLPGLASGLRSQAGPSGLSLSASSVIADLTATQSSISSCRTSMRRRSMAVAVYRRRCAPSPLRVLQRGPETVLPRVGDVSGDGSPIS